MRKNYLLLTVLCLWVGSIFAQNSIGGLPPSFKKNFHSKASVSVMELQKPDMKKIAEEDEIDAKSGVFYKIGRSVNVNVSIDNAGSWTELTSGGKIWRLKLSCADAQGLTVYYDNFYLPRGSQLFLYNENGSQVIGAFTHNNNPESGTFATEMIQGESVTLEYYQPNKMIDKPIINISHVSYVYRGANFLFSHLKINESASCQVNINCTPEGTNWQDEKKGVARILLTTSAGQGWCSGTLINNTAQDCKKYFLTADHCGEGASTANLTQWIFYFNYEAAGCTNPTSATYKSMVGCTKKANGGGGGNTGSDFYLVELTTANFPTGLVPWFNGWNRNTTATAGGVSIHHPAGDIKKISTFTGTPVSSQWGSAAGSHWRVTWTATTNGHGVTEGGSSGSPLFDSNGRVIGDLTGGGSYCTAPTSPDYYGKFSYSWLSNGTTAATQLKPWLDPTNSGVMTLDGILSPCSPQNNPPVADFTANITTVTQGGSVSFTDQSTNTPTSWSWSFTSGTPTTSTIQNPSVVYNTVGTFTVALTATNAYGNNTKTKTAYINVVPAGTSTCDTVKNFTGTPTVYGVASPQSGYMAGNNSYADKSKAEYFGSYAPYTKIDKFLVYFGVAKGGSSNITFNVLNQSAGKPGTVVGTKTVSLTTIKADVTASNPTLVDFVDFAIPGPFYLEVVLPTTPGDTLAIITNVDGEATTNTCWEKWSDNAWYAYDDANAWGTALNHKIFAILCTDGSAGTAPVANFSGTPTTLNVGGTVAFTDLSTNIPTSWSWSFAGGTPTTSTLQNPTITYNTAGTYNVTLTATNATGNNAMTKTGYIIVNQGTVTTCDTVSNFVGTPAIYGVASPQSGYMSGNNSYGDKSKAEYFANYAPFTKIDKFIVYFGVAKGGSSNITFNVLNQSAGKPGTVIGTTTVSLTTIKANVTAQLPTVVDFTDITIPGPFYFEVVLPTTAGDTLAIITNTQGDATVNTAWEKWSDNAWYAFDDASAWGAAYNLAIDVVLCPYSVSVNGLNEASITVFPNPTTGNINVNLSNIEGENVIVNVYDILGNIVAIKNSKLYENSNMSIDLNKLSSGIYYMNINIDGKSTTKRISIQK